MKQSDINSIVLGIAIGQCHPELEPGSHMEELVKYAKKFTKWEKENVLSLPDGWESYQEQGGNDYESEIFEWAKEFEV